jgi:hypothetical protein
MTDVSNTEYVHVSCDIGPITMEDQERFWSIHPLKDVWGRISEEDLLLMANKSFTYRKSNMKRFRSIIRKAKQKA